MAERFDVLVQGITQEDALSLLFAKQRLSIDLRIDILRNAWVCRHVSKR